ncbi:MAG: malto-oligosyltrehalose synthase [Pirellulaceae bacterium]
MANRLTPALDRDDSARRNDMWEAPSVDPSSRAQPSSGSLPPKSQAVRDGAETTVPEVVRRVQEIIEQTPLPVATYRLQFSRDFTFADATKLVPYLHNLGISHVYASPYLRSTKGSQHGYDIVDHTRLDPELGTDADFHALVGALRAHRMGHLLDLVPNHMGIGSDENSWWQDVLENGPSSPYAGFFDIDWKPLKPDLTNKVLLPVLGDQFGAVLESQQLVLQYADGAFTLQYYGRSFPIAPRSYAMILKHRLEELQRRLGEDHPHLLEYQSIVTSIGHLPGRDVVDPQSVLERQREKEVVKRRLQRLGDESPLVLQFIRENVAEFNGRAGDARSFDLLDALLNDQAYRLSYWRVAADEVNYRRFFDVNELAAVCMENPQVFERTHARVMQLLYDGQLDGLRIDHADGLYDPTGYLWDLQRCRFRQLCRKVWLELRDTTGLAATEPSPDECEKWLRVFDKDREEFGARRQSGQPTPLSRPVYIVVEKILEGEEPLPGDWPVHGTTGYEFLNMVNGWFVCGRHDRQFDRIYRQFTRERRDFEELVYHSKRLIMRVSMAGELNLLGHQLDRLSEHDRRSRDFTENGLTHALREIVACFPVYRTYTREPRVLERDQRYIHQAVSRAKQRNPAVSQAVFDFIQDVLSLKYCESASPGVQASVLEFVRRLQQFTGPVMAKSVEDTAFYNFHRLISLNEVGGNPQQFGMETEDFHAFNLSRLRNQPAALSATATHDTKRGEDTRARINVLSEMPQRWKDHVLRWARWNKRKKTKVDGEPAPSRADEYLLYQTLVGTWPFEAPRGPALTEYLARLHQYMTKALREGKAHSSWIAPNEAYERATLDFLTAILADEPLTGFRTDFEPFATQVAWAGIWNSLSQTLLKLVSPGVPDVFQGTELWDFSLVDPDNRRPVDYARRSEILTELDTPAEGSPSRAERARELVAAAPDGRIKLYLMAAVLRWRREHPELFAAGDYIAHETRGQHARQLLALTRRSGDLAFTAVVPRWTTTLCEAPGQPPLGLACWEDTQVVLSGDLATWHWRDLITGRDFAGAALEVGEVLGDFPVGVLVGSSS